MNIFYMHESPQQCAEWMVDRHVVKMILETAQLLSTTHRYLDGDEWIDQTKNGRNIKRWALPDNRESIMYKATHINHPSAVWTRQSVENYLWLVDHLFALLGEYKYRYEKVHAVEGNISWMLQSPPHKLEEWDMTEMPCAMPDEYKISKDPTITYRNYYKHAKSHLHSWKKRNPPEWII